MVNDAAPKKPLGLKVYRGLATLAGLAGWPWFYWRLKSRGFGESFLPRLGLSLPAINAPVGSPRIWLHGVSVGEIAGVEPLVRELKQCLPQGRLFLSTGTETGQAVARRLYAPSNTVFYYPLDLPWAVRRYLEHIQPSLYVALETEIWPNFLLAARDRGIKLALVNGRLSDKSLRRYLKFNSYIKYIINLFDLIAAGSQEDARRFLALGVAPEKVVCTGNTKFERRPNPAAQAQADGFREKLGLEGEPGLFGSLHPPWRGRGCYSGIYVASPPLPCPAIAAGPAPSGTRRGGGPTPEPDGTVLPILADDKNRRGRSARKRW